MIIPETSTSMLKDYLMYNNETVGSLPQERGGDGRGGGGEGIGAYPQDLTFCHGVCQFPIVGQSFFCQSMSIFLSQGTVTHWKLTKRSISEITKRFILDNELSIQFPSFF